MLNANTNNDKIAPQKEAGPAPLAARAPEGELPLTFEEIYKEYGERTLNLLFRFTSREQVARDLQQDVFIKVYENMGSFEKRSQIYTWIYRIAVNHAINYMGRERRTLWFDLLDETVGDLLRRDKVEVAGFGVQDVPMPDELLERSETEQFVREAVDALPVKYKVPFLLFKDEHLSYNEIAEILGLSLSAVETRIHRARKTLIQRLTPLIK